MRSWYHSQIKVLYTNQPLGSFKKVGIELALRPPKRDNFVVGEHKLIF